MARCSLDSGSSSWLFLTASVASRSIVSLQRENSLLHSCAPWSSWLRGKPCLYPPGGWLLGRVIHPWQLMRIRINSWGKWQLKFKSELNVLNIQSFLHWSKKICFISNKYKSYNTLLLQNIAAVPLKQIPHNIFSAVNIRNCVCISYM